MCYLGLKHDSWQGETNQGGLYFCFAEQVGQLKELYPQQGFYALEKIIR